MGFIDSEMQVTEGSSSWKKPSSSMTFLGSPRAESSYTSLKDIIVVSPKKDGSPRFDDNAFDSPIIAFKDQLVKRAAWAYLRSAVVLTDRDQISWMARSWGKLKARVLGSLSGWREYVLDPMPMCLSLAGRSLCRAMAYMRIQIAEFVVRMTTLTAWSWIRHNISV